MRFQDYDFRWRGKTLDGEVIWTMDAMPDVADGWVNSVAVLPDGLVIYSATAQASEPFAIRRTGFLNSLPARACRSVTSALTR